MGRWKWGGGVTVLTQCPRFPPRCPFQGDNYRTRLIPVGPASPELPFPSHYQRFVISTFAFVEPPSMAVLEGEVRGIPPNPSAGNPSLLGILQCWESPIPTPTPLPGSHPFGKLTLLSGVPQGSGVLFGGSLEACGDPFRGSPGDAGIPVAPRCTSPAALPCATWPSPSPAGPPASWECPHVSLGASRGLGGDLCVSPSSQANLLLPTGARRSPGHRSTGESVGTVTSQGRVVFPELPKGGGTQQRG